MFFLIHLQSLSPSRHGINVLAVDDDDEDGNDMIVEDDDERIVKSIVEGAVKVVDSIDGNDRQNQQVERQGICEHVVLKTGTRE